MYRDPLESPRVWALIYAGFVALLVIAFGAFDWRPMIVTIEIPPLLHYGAKGFALWAFLILAHTLIGDRFHVIDTAVWRWLLYADRDRPARQIDRGYTGATRVINHWREDAAEDEFTRYQN